jgi:D-beta-D-heptose 7-phosphate kinase / D-beta-D-heptose 1-phosphate adenosyltransferase
MIVTTDQLSRYRGEVAMIDGGFDPLHAGHVEYMREAAGLGAPVLCNVSSDDWVGRKHPPLLEQAERVKLVDAIRYVDYTHPSSIPTVAVLRELRPRFYVKGADWRGRLPDDEVAACEELDIEPVFLDTVLDSSTRILERYTSALQGSVG